jgi:cobalamin synthase
LHFPQAQQATRTPRHISVIVALLLLIIATLLAGPVGFLIMAVLLLTWALVTGTLHLVIDLILLPFRLLSGR